MNNKDRIIDACIESEEMRDYLKKQDLSDYVLTEIITGSNLSLNKKMNLYALSKDEYAVKMRAETQRALDEIKIKTGEILCMTECWYDGDELDEKEGFAAPFTSYEAAIKYLQDEIEEEEWDKESLCWTEFSKWIPSSDGTMKKTYTYYLIRDEIVYFKQHDAPSHHQNQGYISSLSLDLPIPFEAGDIVTLNCLPFAPVKHALLTKAENRSCCGVQMLFRDTNGEWKIRALKHGWGWGSYHPILSPLYRLEKDDGYLEKEAYLLEQLQPSLRKEKE